MNNTKIQSKIEAFIDSLEDEEDKKCMQFRFLDKGAISITSYSKFYLDYVFEELKLILEKADYSRGEYIHNHKVYKYRRNTPIFSYECWTPNQVEGK